MAYRAIPPSAVRGIYAPSPTGTPVPKISVHTGSKILVVGDSLVANAWYDQAQSTVGGTNLLVQQLLPAVVTAINSGVGGNQVADIDAAIAARITDYNPDVVIIDVGINDCRGVPIGPTPLATFRASYDHIITTVQATLPTVQIACVSLLLLFEKWASSPAPTHFSGNPLDSGAGSIDVYNGEIQASARVHGCVYIDVRAPAAIAEASQNTPEPGVASGVLTGDGLHPLAAGQLVMSTAARGWFTVS